MKGDGLGACLLALLISTGCGSATPAATTRVLGPNAALMSTLPVCFTPPSSSTTLTEQAVQRGTIEICQSAARGQGVVVVPFENSRCLAATLAFSDRDTSERETKCAGSLTGVECESTGFHLKAIKVTLSASGAAVAESTARIRSNYGEFSRESYRSLCAAAFHDYPRALSNVQFDVPVE